MATEPRRSDSARREAPRRQGAATNTPAWRRQLHSWWLHHRKVALDSGHRLWAAPFSSLMTGIVLGIALALPLALLLILGSLQGISQGWDEAARINVYLGDGVTEQRARALQRTWYGDERIADVRLITREDALEEFKGRSGLAQAFDYLDVNPLPHTLIVTPESAHRDQASLEALVTELQDVGDMDQVQLDLAWLQRLNAIADVLRRGVWAIGWLLAAAVILVIGNTVRLHIENRRDEILVTKLVGATDSFVRRPFLYTGLWYGFLGGVLAWWLVEVAFWWLGGPVARLGDLYGSPFALLRPGFVDVLLLLGAAMLIGWLGAWLAVLRHLTEIEPR